MKALFHSSLSFLFLLYCSCCFAQKQSAKTKSIVRPYPYYVEPEEYPDYTRRPFVTPSWNTFENKVQFVGGRGWGKEFGIIDEIPPYWMAKGTVMRPNYSHFMMNPEALKQTLTQMKERGYYLFNINAFGPGTPPVGSFGQIRVEKWKVDMMKEILGDHYLGFDLGEQDGRYWADCRSIDYPMSDDYSERYLKAMKYMQKAAREQGDVISMLSVKWFWHYPMKDGFITCSGAESQNKSYTSNDQVHYAFIRGASKQYGLLWYGDISVFNSWGYKSYGEITETTNPRKGNSIAWMKRMLLSQYQYNSAILGFEGSLYQGDTGKETISPIGMLQTDMQQFIEKHPKPGPQYTPTALLLDYFSGWMTPNEPFEDKYKVWNFLPYRAGDFLTHHLLDMFYEDYDQVGLNKNEYGGLCNTPYGDALDVLLSDARVSTLSRYAIVVVGGELSTNTVEVADKLTNYMNKGGHVVITVDNARKLFPQTVGNTSNYHFKVDEFAYQKGKLSVIHSKNMGILADNSMDKQLKAYLDGVFKSTRIFSVGDSLGYVTNIEGKGKYLLGIYNHSLSSKPFKIECHVGDILKIEELHPIRDLSLQVGYFPEGFEKLSPEISSQSTLAAADVRLFQVTIDEDKEKIKYLSKTTIEKIVSNRFLTVNSLLGLADRLQCMPTFFDHFSGVNIHWNDLQVIDSLSFSEDAWWYNLKKLQFSISFDPSFEKAYQNDKKLLSKMVNTISASKYVTYLLIPATIEVSVRKAIANVFAYYPDVRLIDPQTQKKLILWDVPCQSWKELYPSIKGMEQKISLPRPVTTNTKRLLKGKVKPENSTYYFSYHENKKSLVDELLSNPIYFSSFGGVKIDATYLYMRSLGQCSKEVKQVENTGLKLIVDFTREINNYPDMTWMEELEYSYVRSVNMYRQVFEKMKAAKIHMAIIGSHMRPEMWKKEFGRTPEESIVNGMSAFIKLAAEYDITVYLQNSTHKFYPSKLIAKPNEVVATYRILSAECSNLKLAANLGLGDLSNELINTFSPYLGVCIFSSPGATDRDYTVPFGRSKEKETFTIDENIIKIMDGDYRSPDELILDKQLVDKKYVHYFGVKQNTESTN